MASAATSPVAFCETLISSRTSNFYLTSFLAEVAERWPDRTLTVDGVDITFGKAWLKVLQIATWLQQNGVRRGDRVIAVLRQSPDLHLITLAVAHVGAVVSVLSTQVRSEGFHTILDECQPVCVFLEKTTRHLRKDVEGILTVWMDSGVNAGGWEEAEFSEVMATAPAWGMRYPGTADDPAFLVYPPNSTGTSQGVLLSHNRVRSYLADERRGSDDMLSIFQSVPCEHPDASEAFATLSESL